jgi:hypothetical protein
MMQRAENKIGLNYAGPDIFAVDPGVNFGLTIATAGGLWLYHGSLLKTENALEYGWYAMQFILSTMKPAVEPFRFVLEGAAYNKIFGQVGLSAVRAGFYLGARTLLEPESIDIIAPMAARKKVFNDGKAEPWLYWPTIQHNAVDSLVLALAAMGAQVRPEAQD